MSSFSRPKTDLPAPDRDRLMALRRAGRSAGFFLIAQFVLMWTSFFVLSSSINWPASLDDPASVALPRLLEHYGSVMTGYGLYLAVALLLVPATAALNVRFGLRGALGQTTLALAIISALAKAIGIARWLFAAPVLARAYDSAGADQNAIDLLFTTLNDYAGGIGEILGVALITGLWTVLVGAVIMQSRGRTATIAGGFVVAMGISLFAAIPAGFGVDVGPVLTLSNIGWQFGMVAIALMALQKPARV
ncbi:DUF4386 family protein [Nodosilinea nodulosa]|uniref:DUF4386 family protein n=1 Tax=Nodosilinea nodulosa TaxID=416001 RepID=UPI00047480DB|nr:DUF4386 family protein [Nodosilinea nodulosa]